MIECLVGLGSNLGDRAHHLARAADALRGTQGVEHVRASRVVETPPLGGPEGQPGYLNAAIRFRTVLSPSSLWHKLAQIERQAGRRREIRWGPRTLDLDLLLYGDWILRTSELTIPHPRMSFRSFVLEPAAQVAPEMVHPPLGWTLKQLRTHLNRANPYLAIAGLPSTGKRELAAWLAVGSARRITADVDPWDWVAQRTGQPEARSLEFPVSIDDAGVREFVESLAQRIATDGVTPPGRPAVSDFWYDELGIALAAMDNTPTVRHPRPSCEPHLPKLLVVLTAPPEWLTAQNREDGPWHDGRKLDACQQRLLVAARNCRRPILELDASRPEEVLAEAQAALAAIA